MFNNVMPSREDLPTSAQLTRSTLIALGIAVILLITVVMPAEYGIDPLRVGRLLGLTKMGEIKRSLRSEETARMASQPALPALEPIAQAPAPIPEPVTPQPVAPRPSAVIAAAPTAPAGEKSDTLTLVLKPDAGAEIKLVMNANQEVQYSWQAKGGKINYDTHGDPVKAPKGFYHGYGKGRQVAGDEGVLAAAFDGKHGWFWRNRSGRDVTVTLNVQGSYSEIKRSL